MGVGAGECGDLGWVLVIVGLFGFDVGGVREMAGLFSFGWNIATSGLLDRIFLILSVCDGDFRLEVSGSRSDLILSTIQVRLLLLDVSYNLIQKIVNIF